MKICGVTRIRDALAAANAGADLIGLNFFSESPRYVRASRARVVADRVRGRVKIVGVFVNADERAVREIDGDVGLDYLQFHGDEPADFVRRFGDRAIKAFQLARADDLSEMRGFPCPLWHLVDAVAPGTTHGGSGRRANWPLARRAKTLGPIMLAGGLTPANVAAAIRAVRPVGVDVASGVESSPGVKGGALVRAFVNAAKTA